jgi:ABC-type ATPase with predicted acetyltransferase domain
MSIRKQQRTIMHAKVAVCTPIIRTPRVLQIEGLFDLAPSAQSESHWEVTLPLDERPWHIGLIVGPSGCGKTTVARQLWPRRLAQQPSWPSDRSILDAFPSSMSIKEIVVLLSSVGLSSPPAWLRPYHVLSTGQQFRVTLARLLAEKPSPRVATRGLDVPPREPLVFDEFTSVVDRTVARIASHALAKTVRGRKQQFIALTCHEDVEPWLNPDWVYRPASNSFTWRLLQRRPPIVLRIVRVGRNL